MKKEDKMLYSFYSQDEFKEGDQVMIDIDHPLLVSQIVGGIVVRCAFYKHNPLYNYDTYLVTIKVDKKDYDILKEIRKIDKISDKIKEQL